MTSAGVNRGTDDSRGSFALWLSPSGATTAGSGFTLRGGISLESSLRRRRKLRMIHPNRSEGGRHEVLCQASSERRIAGGSAVSEPVPIRDLRSSAGRFPFSPPRRYLDVRRRSNRRRRSAYPSPRPHRAQLPYGGQTARCERSSCSNTG